MKKFIYVCLYISIYGWVYILTFFKIKLYFSQWGKIEGDIIHQKISLYSIKGYYFYGYAKDNPYW